MNMLDRAKSFKGKMVRIRTKSGGTNEGTLETVDIDGEVDFLGTGAWERYERIPVAGYRYHLFPEGFSAHWVRLVAQAACTATAQFFYS